MKMYVPDINEIWEEILSEKMIKKNRQYGNSVYDEDTIFGDESDPEELIKARLDDKLRRMKTLSSFDEKYDSELMEIVAYLMHLLNWRRNSGKYEEEEIELKELGKHKIWWEHIEESTGKIYRFPKPDRGDNRQPGDKEQSSKSIREICEDNLRILGLRRLSGGKRRNLREEDFQ